MRPVLLALATLLAACAVEQPQSRHPRPALPLPPGVAARYALPGPVVEETFVPIGGENGVAFFRARLVSGDEVAELHYLRPQGEDVAPFVLCLPILGGGDALMWILALDLARKGYAVAWADRIESAMRVGQRGAELEELFRRTVVQDRMALAWARTQPGIDAARTGILGVSVGGMVGAALLAVEPDVRAATLCITGGDLADLVLRSTERRVERWVEWRQRDDGMAASEIEREFERELLSDPIRLAPFVATGRVLLVGTTADGVVPPRHQDLLWEAFGRPRRALLPLGHYSAAIALPGVLATADAFFRDRFAAPPE